MSGALFGIDATSFGVWRGHQVNVPGGVERNRTCAADWAADRRAGNPHTRDGYLGAIVRAGTGRSRVTYEFTPENRT